MKPMNESMEIKEEPPVTVLQPQGRLGLEKASKLLKEINAAQGDVEFDLTEINAVEVGILQLIVVTVASLRRRGRAVIVKDNEEGVLRSTLLLAGIPPEQAGLSASLQL